MGKGETFGVLGAFMVIAMTGVTLTNKFHQTSEASEQDSQENLIIDEDEYKFTSRHFVSFNTNSQMHVPEVNYRETDSLTNSQKRDYIKEVKYP